jgi:hypothetical protein
VRKERPVVRERQVRQWRPERQENVSKKHMAVGRFAEAGNVDDAGITVRPPR